MVSIDAHVEAMPLRSGTGGQVTWSIGVLSVCHWWTGRFAESSGISASVSVTRVRDACNVFPWASRATERKVSVRRSARGMVELCDHGAVVGISRYQE